MLTMVEHLQKAWERDDNRRRGFALGLTKNQTRVIMAYADNIKADPVFALEVMAKVKMGMWISRHMGMLGITKQTTYLLSRTFNPDGRPNDYHGTRLGEVMVHMRTTNADYDFLRAGA